MSRFIDPAQLGPAETLPAEAAALLAPFEHLPIEEAYQALRAMERTGVPALHWLWVRHASANAYFAQPDELAWAKSNLDWMRTCAAQCTPGERSPYSIGAEMDARHVSTQEIARAEARIVWLETVCAPARQREQVAA